MEESFDLFRMRLDLMVRPDHPLEILGTRIRWDEIENNLGHLFQRKPRQVREMELEGMFGKHRVMVSAEPSRAGRKQWDGRPHPKRHQCAKVSACTTAQNR